MGLNCKWWHQTLEPGPSPVPELLTSAVPRCHSSTRLFQAVSTFFPRDHCRPWFLMQRRGLNKLVWLMKSTTSLHIFSYSSPWKGRALYKGQIWGCTYTDIFKLQSHSYGQGAPTALCLTRVFGIKHDNFRRLFSDSLEFFWHFLSSWHLKISQNLKWLDRHLVLFWFFPREG